MILNVDSVENMNDIVVRYINHLLYQHARDQHMLINQKVPDDRLMELMQEKRYENAKLTVINDALMMKLGINTTDQVIVERDQVADVRAKNTELESVNRALNAANNHLRQQLEAARVREDGALKSLGEARATLEAYDAKVEDLEAKNKLYIEEIDRLKAAANLPPLSVVWKYGDSSTHPWDVMVPTNPDNPLAQNARCVIHDKNAWIAKLEEDIRKLEFERKQNSLMPAATALNFDERCWDWAMATFDESYVISLEERAMCLMEEAIEAAQTVGVHKARLKLLLDFVYSKGIGDLPQELGGVAVTLALFCKAVRRPLPMIQEAALNDCWNRQMIIKDKHKAKLAAGVSGDVRPTQSVEVINEPGTIAKEFWDKVISDGNAAREAHIQKTRQGERGEN